MVVRKQFQTVPEADPELAVLLKAAKTRPVSEEDLHEQRISFAYGNALGSERITKESVRQASRKIRLG